MPDGYQVAAIEELPQLYDGFFKLVRSGLGLSAFGAQVMDMPPGHTTRSHDESATGQQELYVGMRGSGAVIVGDERLPLDPDHMVRVDAGNGRVVTAGPDGLRVLCIGGVPGGVYEPPEWTA